MNEIKDNITHKVMYNIKFYAMKNNEKQIKIYVSSYLCLY